MKAQILEMFSCTLYDLFSTPHSSGDFGGRNGLLERDRGLLDTATPKCNESTAFCNIAGKVGNLEIMFDLLFGCPRPKARSRVQKQVLVGSTRILVSRSQ